MGGSDNKRFERYGTKDRSTKMVDRAIWRKPIDDADVHRNLWKRISGKWGWTDQLQNDLYTWYS